MKYKNIPWSITEQINILSTNSTTGPGKDITLVTLGLSLKDSGPSVHSIAAMYL